MWGSVVIGKRSKYLSTRFVMLGYKKFGVTMWEICTNVDFRWEKIVNVFED